MDRNLSERLRLSKNEFIYPQPRESEARRLLDRLIDCLRDINLPGEPPEARKNAHENIQALARLSGGPGPFLRKFMEGWTEETLGHAIADLDVLEIELTSRGY